MWGCESEEIALASRSKRAFSVGVCVSSEERTLMATVRSKRVSRARYTSPMPPTPTTEVISYGPSLLPVAKDTVAEIIAPDFLNLLDLAVFNCNNLACPTG